MNEVTTVEARTNFAELINKVLYKDEEFLLTRRGKPVAIISPISKEDEKASG